MKKPMKTITVISLVVIFYIIGFLFLFNDDDPDHKVSLRTVTPQSQQPVQSISNKVHSDDGKQAQRPAMIKKLV